MNKEADWTVWSFLNSGLDLLIKQQIGMRGDFELVRPLGMRSSWNINILPTSPPGLSLSPTQTQKGWLCSKDLLNWDSGWLLSWQRESHGGVMGSWLLFFLAMDGWMQLLLLYNNMCGLCVCVIDEWHGVDRERRRWSYDCRVVLYSGMSRFWSICHPRRTSSGAPFFPPCKQ
jgi:hypothetical protein